MSYTNSSTKDNNVSTAKTLQITGPDLVREFGERSQQCSIRSNSQCNLDGKESPVRLRPAAAGTMKGPGCPLTAPSVRASTPLSTQPERQLHCRQAQWTATDPVTPPLTASLPPVRRSCRANQRTTAPDRNSSMANSTGTSNAMSSGSPPMPDLQVQNSTEAASSSPQSGNLVT